MSVNVRVSGLRSTLAFFELLKPRVEAATQGVINTYAYKIEHTAKRLAPVDTGRLRSSITTVLKRLAAEVGTDVEYAIYQEYGTRYHEAQPFLLPAFEQHLQDFYVSLKAAIRQATRG